MFVFVYNKGVFVQDAVLYQLYASQYYVCIQNNNQWRPINMTKRR